MTEKILPKNDKVLFFSDLHLGVHQNATSWHNTALDLADWISSVMKKHKLDTIFFAGDVFHDRHSIGVNTLHVAQKFFSRLKDFNIYVLPGNHDAFFSDTVEVNSVEILSNTNTRVFSTPTTIQVLDKYVTFCPWKTDITQLEEVDMLVGHFEIPNFKLNSSKICTYGYPAKEFFKKASKIITGHFHYREHRQYDDQYVLYLGSPYEMDFSDCGQEKGLSVIDFSDLNKEVLFIKNDISPKHYRLRISELSEGNYKDVSKLIEKNIISLYVDRKIDALLLDKLTTILLQYKPLQFRTEFDVLDKAQTSFSDNQKLSIDIEEAFHEFVENIETRATKKEVLSYCLDLFRSCQKSHE